MSTEATDQDGVLNYTNTLGIPGLQQIHLELVWETCSACDCRYKITLEHDCLQAMSRRIKKLEQALKAERSEHNKLRTQFIFFMEQYEKDKKLLKRVIVQNRTKQSRASDNEAKASQ